MFMGWECGKSQPTSVRLPAGELLSVWVSESEENRLSELRTPLSPPSLCFFSPPSRLSPSLPLLHHFSAGVRTQRSIGKLKPPPSPSSSSSKTASLVIGINTWKLNGCADLCPQNMVAAALRTCPHSQCLFALTIPRPFDSWPQHHASVVRMKQ